MATTPETCCEILAYYLERECPIHEHPWDCPDRLFYRAADGEIGIVLRDGGSSFVTMLYCPFCAQELPFNGTDDERAALEADISTGGDPLRRVDLGALGED